MRWLEPRFFCKSHKIGASQEGHEIEQEKHSIFW